MALYTGGCHCGNIRFEAEADVAITSAMDCNCSHCANKGFLLSFVPATAFRITHGDESKLTEYKFNTMNISHLFCPVCGVQSYGRGKGPDGTETIMLNVRCLDGVDLKNVAITEFDGKSL